ncbi:MAG TPA: hypothetical protein VK699_00060 [Terriglobales bacterium]|jgi:hypothetical protein|nr:hypothetical protein [Terriglobales bacterium]
MKRILLFLLFIVVVQNSPLQGQNRFEIGAFADYLHLAKIDTHHAGLGGRFSGRIYPHVLLAGEVAYDFAQPFTEQVSCPRSPCNLFLIPSFSNVAILHGMFGPEFQIGSQNIRIFATAKGGFVNFRIRPENIKSLLFQSLRNDNTNGVLYSGGGMEFYKNHLGLRLDVGNEIYFNHGANHNLRASFGPVIRF